MRLLFIAAAAFAAGCSHAPPAAEPPKRDLTQEAWYGQTVDQLAAMNRQVEDLLRRGKTDAAAEIITKGQPLMSRLLSAPRPTLAAIEAVSDLDHLYGSMLLKNRNYGWARLFFQKNLARWRIWSPRTEEVARRLKLAESSIVECDRKLGN